MSPKPVPVTELFTSLNVESLIRKDLPNVMFLTVDADSVDYQPNVLIPRFVIEEHFGNIFSEPNWELFSQACLEACAKAQPFLFPSDGLSPAIVIFPIFQKGECRKILCWTRQNADSPAQPTSPASEPTGGAETNLGAGLDLGGDVEERIMSAIEQLGSDTGPALICIDIADVSEIAPLLTKVAAAIKTVGIDPSRLCFSLPELSETSAVLVAHYRTLGVTVARRG